MKAVTFDVYTGCLLYSATFQLGSLILFLVGFSSSTYESLQKIMRHHMKFQPKWYHVCESRKTRSSKERIFRFLDFDLHELQRLSRNLTVSRCESAYGSFHICSVHLTIPFLFKDYFCNDLSCQDNGTVENKQP